MELFAFAYYSKLSSQDLQKVKIFILSKNLKVHNQKILPKDLPEWTGWIDFILVLFQLQWCNLTLARRFWATKVCLRASKISKICLFDCPTGRATSWKANFENYSRHSLIKGINSYQYNTAWAILFKNSINRPKRCNLIENKTLAQIFSCEFCETSRNNFFLQKLFGRLLLN